MIKKAAAGYVGWLCANGIVAPEKNKIYAYGMELVLSGLVNVLSVLLISILIFHPADWLALSCGLHPPADNSGRIPRKFPPVLQYSFPQHVCCVGVPGTFASEIRFRHSLSSYSSHFTCNTADPIASEAKNKPLTPEQRRRNRRRSLILGGLNLAIGISLSGAFKRRPHGAQAIT